MDLNGAMSEIRFSFITEAAHQFYLIHGLSIQEGFRDMGFYGDPWITLSFNQQNGPSLMHRQVSSEVLAEEALPGPLGSEEVRN